MCSKNSFSFIDRISQSQSFYENWAELRNLDYLHIPVGWDGEVTASPDDALAVRDVLDRPGVEAQPGYRAQLVYIDSSRADEKTILAKAEAFEVLHRTFRSKACEGMLFNPPKENESDYQAYTMHTWGLPRLCGLLKSKSPELDWEQHLEQSRVLADANDMYTSYYHSAEAREMGAPIHRVFLLEFDALITLGLYEQAQSFLEWFYPQCKKQEMLILPQARFMTIVGQPEKAVQLIKPLLMKSSTDPFVWLERARALFRQNRVQDAITAFKQCLERAPENLDATLGLGIATRALHYDSGDRGGLEEAAGYFEKVIANGEYFKAESYHHLGTVCLALEDFQRAENAFEQALASAPSPVSRRNLALVLHAQEKVEQGEAHARFLMDYFPKDASGLERYYPSLRQGQTFVVHTSNEELQSAEQLDALSTKAFDTLKAFGLCLRGDLMDFRRFDEYVNYYAPCGKFLPSSSLSSLSEQDFQAALCQLALHLSGVLVRGGHATWVPTPSQKLDSVSVKFCEGPTSGTTLGFFSSLLRRVKAGSASDNLTNLDFIVSGCSGYRSLSETYETPFVTFEMEPERISELKARGGRAMVMMKSIGLPLNGDSNDLRQMDLAITSFFDDTSDIRRAVTEGRFTDSSIEDLGIYLGFLIQKMAGGVWYDHPDVLGIAIRGLTIQEIFPVSKVTNLFQAGRPSDAISSLVGLEAPLALAQLSRKVNQHEITTREQLSEALATAVPSILLEDPSGASLNRMVDMVTAMSAVQLAG